MNGTTCSACSVLNCRPGFHPSECTLMADSVCIPCTPPSGQFNWTTGCEFACATGYFAFNSQCSQCVVPTCAPGSYPSPCSAGSNSVCLACVPPVGNYAWLSSGTCQYTCAAGWYRTAAGCVQCSQLSCAPGTYAGQCGATADAICLNCSGGGPGVVWTSGCSFICQPGVYWLSGGTLCKPCSSPPQCNAGWYPSACTATSDVACAQCTVVPNSMPTVGCDYVCNAGYFMAADRSCAACSQLVCPAGKYALPCNRTTDATCTACIIPTAAKSVRWTGGCAYVCASGYYAEGALCIACNNAVQCPPGFTQSECAAGQDIQCVPCTNFQAGYLWTNGCDFVCAPGYYQSDVSCIPCSTSACAPGTYAVECSAFADTFCIGCPVPIGAYTWTDGCNFKCAQGRFLSGMTCVPCSTPVCAAGKYASNCTATTDSICTNCVRPLNSVGLVWTTGCQYGCNTGYYSVVGSGCLPCSASLVCAPGTYLVPCSLYADARCAPCQVTMPTGMVWTTGCSFACLSGFYRQNSTCKACSTNLNCAPGFFATACAPTADSVCSACGPLGVGAVFTTGCDFACKTGYYTRSGACYACTVFNNCTNAPGYYLTPCTNTSNAICNACRPPTGSFTWSGGGCAFVCASGFVLYNGTQCLAIEKTQTYAEVNTTLAIDNTVAQVCSDLSTLLEAMSNTISSFGQGPSTFVTNIVTLDGRPCVSNACPQCNARRLLASSVSVVALSTSTTPFNITVSVAPSQFTTALRATLQNTTLQPRTIVVSLTKVYKPMIIFPALIGEEAMYNLWEHHGELIFLMLGFVSIALVSVFAFYHFVRRKTREVLVRCGIFAGVRLTPPRGPYGQGI